MAFWDSLKEAQDRADRAYGYSQDMSDQQRAGTFRGPSDDPNMLAAQQQKLMELAAQYGASPDQLQNTGTGYDPNAYTPQAQQFTQDYGQMPQAPQNNEFESLDRYMNAMGYGGQKQQQQNPYLDFIAALQALQASQNQR